MHLVVIQVVTVLRMESFVLMFCSWTPLAQHKQAAGRHCRGMAQRRHRLVSKSLGHFPRPHHRHELPMGQLVLSPSQHHSHDRSTMQLVALSRTPYTVATTAHAIRIPRPAKRRVRLLASSRFVEERTSALAARRCVGVRGQFSQRSHWSSRAAGGSNDRCRGCFTLASV